MAMNYKSNHLLDNVDPVENLNTGDILFTYNGDGDVWYDIVFNNQQFSPYKHIGMVVNNPDFNDIKLYGLYVLEINQIYSGCKGPPRLTRYKDFIRGSTRVDARCWKNNIKVNETKFKNTYNTYLSQNNYSCGIVGKCLHSFGFACCKTSTEHKYFWASELIVFMLNEMKLIKPTKALPIYTIQDLSTLKDTTAHNQLNNLIRII